MINIWDEAEYERITSLPHTLVTYGVDHETFDVPFYGSAYVYKDGDDIILRWYSAQPAPDLSKLPPGVNVADSHMYLDPHYACFARLRGELKQLEGIANALQ